MSYDKIDQELFYASDAPLNAADEVIQSIHDQIEDALVDFEDPDTGDLCFSPYVAVPVSMLWRLSRYYSNNITTKQDVDRWQETLIGFLDGVAAEYHPDEMKTYRKALVGNFARLRKVLREDEE